MALLGLIFIALAKILDMTLSFYNIVVIGAIILSWVRPDPRMPLVRVVGQLTEPVFSFIRKKLPTSFFRSGLDVTPLIVFAIIMFLQTVVVGTLYETGMRLRMDAPYAPAGAPVEERRGLDDLPEL